MRSFVDKKGVLFDLDGTLVDSKPGIFAAIRYTFRELQLPELSEEDMDRPVHWLFLSKCLRLFRRRDGAGH